MQAKDIPEIPVLEFLQCLTDAGRMATWYDLPNADNTVLLAMPSHTPEKVARAKMAALIKRGLVDGCSCGCRGSYEITDKGRELL